MFKALRLATTSLVFAGAMVATAIAGDFDINKTNTGLAMRGYDPVAYFTVKEPTPGSFAITHVHNDVVYRFANKENRNLFKENPAKYLPQYGGFCAFGLAQGVKVDADPELWSVIDGKLYLNLAPPVQKRFSADPKGFITEANTKWTDLKDVDPIKTLN